MASAIAMVARSCASAPRVTSSLRAAQATGGRAYSLLNALAGGTPEPQTHRERRLLRFPREHVYGVVSSVEHYRSFVPWCMQSNVLARKPWGMEAELVVGFQLFAERYTSIVTLEPGKRVEAVARNTQLFHFLRNEWLFEDGPTNPQSASAASSAISASGASIDAVANVPAAADLGTCWVVFRVEFAFRSALYARASGLFFDEVVTKMVSAFERRCAEQLPAYLQAKAAAAAAAMPARRVLTQSSLSPLPLLPAMAAPTPPSALAWPVGRGTAVPAPVPAVRAPPASSATSRAGEGATSHLPAAAPVASAGKGAIQPTASAHGAHSISGAQAAQAVSARVDVPARAAVGEVLRPVVQRHTFSLW